MTSKRLEIFPWNDNFATGIEEIDQQHRKLVELLNALVSHLAYRTDAPTLNRIFDELKEYTALHFSTEERIWHQYFDGDCWNEAHQHTHQEFIEKVLEIKSKEANTPFDAVIEEIVTFLTHWLAMHIIESDKRMAKTVHALKQGATLAQAKEQANKEMEGSARVLIDTVMGMYDQLASRTIQVTREINRRMQLEAELRETQAQLEALTNAAVAESRTKSDFLTNMSHEIRTPLSSVISMTDVLINSGLTPEQSNMAKVIHDSAQAQLCILNDILDFSKIEAGKMHFSVEPLSLPDIIEKTATLYRSHARQKGVTLRWEVDPEIPDILEGDALRVRQILTNFTTNAIKFSAGLDHPAIVDISAHIRKQQDDSLEIALSVKDNGVGMSNETRTQLFTPFAQGNNATEQRYRGAGLGLAISWQLASAMGGNILVDSKLGQGSTFTAVLPFKRSDQIRPILTPDTAPVAAATAPLADRDAALQQGRLILVAEDNETNQEVTREQLAMLGYQCDIADDGQAALSRWQTGNYGLVLTDIHMPNMDGYELAKQIRAEETKNLKRRTPILALTANAIQGEAQRCIDAGADGYLAKPASMSDLKMLLDRWLPEAPAVEKPALSIMILDDEPFMLELIQCMLEELGQFDVACFESGPPALEAIDTFASVPDLVLLDINMPGMDGVEFMQQLAQRSYKGALVVVSGEDDLVMRSTHKLAEEHRLNVLGSLQKPPIRQRLSELLDKCAPQSSADEEHAPRAPRKTYSAAEIHAAIHNGELINFYQPKVALPSGAWIGVETLVRWRHPQDGMVFPDQFIPVAEANGLIGDLTRAVLKGAMRQSHLWQDAGLDLRIAVNVSMEDLSNATFSDFVIEQATRYNIAPQSIVLEVTEGRLMQDFAVALQVLTRLRLKRFRLSIDDFGTGHSSLAQLRDLPFDELKIDRSFTHNAGRDSRLRTIFEASLDMARHLNMEVVAEGVEDDDDWSFLLDTDCQIAQGYYIARPLPAEELPAWHEEWQSRLRKH